MKKRHIALGMIVAAAAVLLVSTFALGAGDGQPGRGHRGPLARLIRSQMGRMITLRADLNVSDEQKAEIRTIIEKHKPEILPVVKKIMDKKRTLHDAILDESPDEDDIRKASKELGKAIGDAAILASEIAREIRPVFTEEQIQIIEKNSNERQGAVDKWLDEIAE
jgi:Spy/CpxP family protein refolding chaperone